MVMLPLPRLRFGLRFGILLLPCDQPGFVTGFFLPVFVVADDLRLGLDLDKGCVITWLPNPYGRRCVVARNLGGWSCLIAAA